MQRILIPMFLMLVSRMVYVAPASYDIIPLTTHHKSGCMFYFTAFYQYR